LSGERKKRRKIIIWRHTGKSVRGGREAQTTFRAGKHPCSAKAEGDGAKRYKRRSIKEKEERAVGEQQGKDKSGGCRDV